MSKGIGANQAELLAAASARWLGTGQGTFLDFQDLEIGLLGRHLIDDEYDETETDRRSYRRALHNLRARGWLELQYGLHRRVSYRLVVGSSLPWLDERLSSRTLSSFRHAHNSVPSMGPSSTTVAAVLSDLTRTPYDMAAWRHAFGAVLQPEVVYARWEAGILGTPELSQAFTAKVAAALGNPEPRGMARSSPVIRHRVASAVVRRYVAEGMIDRALEYLNLGLTREAKSVCDELIARFAHTPDEVIRRHVATGIRVRESLIR